MAPTINHTNNSLKVPLIVWYLYALDWPHYNFEEQLPGQSFVRQGWLCVVVGSCGQLWIIGSKSCLPNTNLLGYVLRSQSGLSKILRRWLNRLERARPWNNFIESDRNVTHRSWSQQAFLLLISPIWINIVDLGEAMEDIWHWSWHSVCSVTGH